MSVSVSLTVYIYYIPKQNSPLCLCQVSKVRFLNINKTLSNLFRNEREWFWDVFLEVLYLACVGVQSVCASLTSLHLLLCCIYPSAHSFINSAVHSSLHPSIQISIHLLRPLTHFTYKRLCW